MYHRISAGQLISIAVEVEEVAKHFVATVRKCNVSSNECLHVVSALHEFG